MGLELCDYDKKAKDAVACFWRTRNATLKKQEQKGVSVQGQRAAVTAGKNMDGFLSIVTQLAQHNGLAQAEAMLDRRVLTLPGYFRPTKNWDLLIFNAGKLIGVFEFKSQVGPSFGNNANNRSEEAIGNGTDFWIAYREGAFGDIQKPFLGFVMLLEDCEKSRKSVAATSPHYDVFPEFVNASYAERYNLLCKKLVQEQLYSAACLLLTPKSAEVDGAYTALSELAGFKTFVTQWAAHCAAEAARAE